MEYNSFYGGRRGASFVIVRTYTSIPEMCTDFGGGEGSNPPNFQEYVLINNTNQKNHKDNGKLFRRGFDFNSGRKIDYYNENNEEQTGNGGYLAYGAEYIGNIIGPAGNAPQVSFTIPTPVPTGQGVISGNQQNGSINFVPGKEGSTFHDNVTYNWYSVRTADQNETMIYIGMTIPYVIYEFDATKVNADYSGSFIVEDTTASQGHPFYKKWNLKIPKGDSGDSVQGFELFTNTGENKVTYDNHDIFPGQSAFIYTLGEETHYVSHYNVLEETKLDNNYHLLARYTSQYRNDSFYDTKNVVNSQGETWNSGDQIWVDLGLFKEYNGIYVQGRVNPGSTNPVTFLNQTYPNGFSNGKIIAIDDRIYAFDYNANPGTWFELGTGTNSAYVKPENTIPANDDDLRNMGNKGLWFVVESFGSTS